MVQGQVGVNNLADVADDGGGIDEMILVEVRCSRCTAMGA